MLQLCGRRFIRAAVVAAAAFVSISAIAAQPRDDEATTVAAAPRTLLTINVTDSVGKPVPNAQAYLVDGTYGLSACKTWINADANGVMVVRSDNCTLSDDELKEPTSIAMIVRAPDMAWTMTKAVVPSDAPALVTLEKGKSVEIAITTEDGRAVPTDLMPIVFSDGNSVAAWTTNVQGNNSDAGEAGKFSAAIAKRVGDGTYRVHVPGDLENMWVLINQPGFMRAFQSGPFDKDAIDSGKVNVIVPAPVSLAVNVKPSTGQPHAYEGCGVTIMLSPEIPDGGWSFRVFDETADGQSLKVALDDLPPANFGVTAMTGTNATRYQRDREDYFVIKDWVEMKPGDSRTFDYELETYDEASQRTTLIGDHAVTFNVKKSDGTPAAGQKYRLAWQLQAFGKELVAAEGEVPADGKLVIKNLAAADRTFLELTVNDNGLGYFMVETEAAKNTHDVQVPPAVGEFAPEIMLTLLADDSTIPLSSLRGKVVFLDFWASWCGPCQEPMKHNNEMLARRSDWQGKAVIVGASIDNSIDIIKEHVAKREWTNVMQAYCSEGEPGWQCDAIKKYAVSGVPTCFLIDREGKIVWTGHPMEIDVEARIDELVKQ